MNKVGAFNPFGASHLLTALARVPRAPRALVRLWRSSESTPVPASTAATVVRQSPVTMLAPSQGRSGLASSIVSLIRSAARSGRNKVVGAASGLRRGLIRLPGDPELPKLTLPQYFRELAGQHWHDSPSALKRLAAHSLDVLLGTGMGTLAGAAGGWSITPEWMNATLPTSLGALAGGALGFRFRRPLRGGLSLISNPFYTPLLARVSPLGASLTRTAGLGLTLAPTGIVLANTARMPYSVARSVQQRLFGEVDPELNERVIRYGPSFLYHALMDTDPVARIVRRSAARNLADEVLDGLWMNRSRVIQPAWLFDTRRWYDWPLAPSLAGLARTAIISNAPPHYSDSRTNTRNVGREIRRALPEMLENPERVFSSPTLQNLVRIVRTRNPEGMSRALHRTLLYQPLANYANEVFRGENRPYERGLSYRIAELAYLASTMGSPVRFADPRSGGVRNYERWVADPVVHRITSNPPHLVPQLADFIGNTLDDISENQGRDTSTLVRRLLSRYDRNDVRRLLDSFIALRSGDLGLAYDPRQAGMSSSLGAYVRPDLLDWAARVSTRQGGRAPYLWQITPDYIRGLLRGANRHEIMTFPGEDFAHLVGWYNRHIRPLGLTYPTDSDVLSDTSRSVREAHSGVIRESLANLRRQFLRDPLSTLTDVTSVPSVRRAMRTAPSSLIDQASEILAAYGDYFTPMSAEDRRRAALPPYDFPPVDRADLQPLSVLAEVARRQGLIGEDVSRRVHGLSNYLRFVLHHRFLTGQVPTFQDYLRARLGPVNTAPEVSRYGVGRRIDETIPDANPDRPLGWYLYGSQYGPDASGRLVPLPPELTRWMPSNVWNYDDISRWIESHPREAEALRQSIGTVFSDYQGNLRPNVDREEASRAMQSIVEALSRDRDINDLSRVATSLAATGRLSMADRARLISIYLRRRGIQNVLRDVQALNRLPEPLRTTVRRRIMQEVYRQLNPFSGFSSETNPSPTGSTGSRPSIFRPMSFLGGR